MEFDFASSFANIIDNLLAWAPKIVGALILIIVGFWIVGWISTRIGKSLDRAKVENELKPFLKSLVSVLLKILVIITAAGVVGIEITAFAALLAAAGLAIGMALQGTLGHFASGVLILLFKPYRVGDLVDIQNVVGHVEEIQIFNTIIQTLDNKKVIMPNGVATSGIMTNLSEKGKLRVDLNVAMPYEEDFDKIQGIILNALKNTDKVLVDEPTVEIEKFDANNILLAVRPYSTPEDYWDVYFGAYRNIKKALGSEGISVAYPRTKVEMLNT